ncbi:flagellin, partial [Pseudorhodoplanes sp.]|uniref:flagellin n=1 Tax=Pseudorhodoplanes sp. TaxID=1934341 RepID=UPI00391B35F8
HRASDLNSLLDAIGQAQKTIEAADHGITAITKLVESAKSIAKQAQQSSQPTATYAQTITGANIPADSPATATSTSDIATVLGAATPSQAASIVIDVSSFATLADEDLLTIEYNGTTYNFEFDDNGSVTPNTPGAILFTDAASLATALGSITGGTVDYDNVANTITITGSGYTAAHEFVIGGAAAAQALVNTTSNNAVDGDVLTINDGTTTGTFRYVASGAVAADGTFSNLATLQAAVAASSLSGISVTGPGGNLQIDAATGSFTVGGQLGNDFGFAATPYEASNATLGGLAGSSLTITAGANSATYNFTANSTRADLDTWLAAQNFGAGITASVNGAGAIEIASTSATNIAITGTGAVLTTLDLDNGTGPGGVYAPVATVATPSTTRSLLETQFNEILSQIDLLARDASYNGINLLNGDNLKVIFNEDGSSFLDIAGVTFSSAGLGIGTLAGGEFQNNVSIDGVLGQVDAALRTLRAQATNFGSKLGTVQTRQNFTKQLINTLQTGADNLVLADTNEEGANMLALQTRQQLSTTALSLSAQADQAVLRLFG